MWMGFGMALNRASQENIASISAFADLDLNGIDTARNVLLQIATHGKCDWMLMVDSDNWAETGASLLTMILDGERLGASIIGAIVKVRGLLPTLNVYSFREERRIEGEEKVVRVQSIPEHDIPAASGPFEVDSIGAAIIAVNMRKIGKAQFSFSNRDGINVSEDLEFCRQVKERGGSIYADPRVKTLHVNKPDILTYEPKT
jgi:hypothetical protein